MTALRQWPPRDTNIWTIEEAQEHFEEVFERAFQDGPQLLTDNGVPVAYLVSKEDWRRKQAGLPLVHDEQEDDDGDSQAN
ncbi:MAG TPA: type II toxin-antitoxin system Phd/YefM family antitoxin [Thermomicrobiales bacterium]|nr:type II toxin-antitoxin system Phd/YefM family antitoxin [Thermomicrobiales bacterium]